MLISLIHRKSGVSLLIKKRRRRYYEEAWWVELRRIEGSMRRNHKRREISLIGREWVVFVEIVLTIRNLGYRHGH